MDKRYKFFTLLLFTLILISFVSAEVGVGISPSKLRFQVTGGEEYEQEVVVFNTGTSAIEISLTAMGDIADYAKISPEKILVQPEPRPHELPLKNSQIFLVKFDFPSTAQKETYTGSLSAVGGSSDKSTLGGNVGVSAKVIAENVPSESFLSKISKAHIMIAGGILFLIFLYLIFRKLGFSVRLKRNKK